jgi:hypothetical protein
MVERQLQLPTPGQNRAEQGLRGKSADDISVSGTHVPISNFMPLPEPGVEVRHPGEVCGEYPCEPTETLAEIARSLEAHAVSVCLPGEGTWSDPATVREDDADLPARVGKAHAYVRDLSGRRGPARNHGPM